MSNSPKRVNSPIPGEKSPTSTILPVPNYPSRELSSTDSPKPKTAREIEHIITSMKLQNSTMQAQIELLQQQVQAKSLLLEEATSQIESAKSQIDNLAIQLTEKELRIEELIERNEELSSAITENIETQYDRMETESESESETPARTRSNSKRKIIQETEDQPSKTKRFSDTRQKRGGTPPKPNPNYNYYTPLTEEASTSQASQEVTETPRKGRETTPDAPTVQDSSESPTQTPKTPRIPPIVIHDKGKLWLKVREWMRTQKVNYTKVSNIKEGISVQTPTPDDYRRLKRYIDDNKISAHSYPKPEDKALQVVLRGIPSEINDTDVKKELEELKFNPSLVIRMKKEGNPMPLVLVRLPKEQKQIFKLPAILDIRIKVEPLRTRAKIAQCHGCQRFGHSQSNCTAPFRCVKCAKAHHTKECKKPRNTPAKCANCNGDHPANFSLCPKRPKTAPPTATPGSASPAPPPAKPAWREPKRLFKNQSQKEPRQQTQQGNSPMAQHKLVNNVNNVNSVNSVNSDNNIVNNNNNNNIFEAMNALQNFLSSFQQQMQQAFVPLVQALSSNNIAKC